MRTLAFYQGSMSGSRGSFVVLGGTQQVAQHARSRDKPSGHLSQNLAQKPVSNPLLPSWVLVVG